jgi:hypothetical protein
VPALRRVKRYAADSGYVYEYLHEGNRLWCDGESRGLEFEFRVRSGREQWLPAAVVIADDALEAWQAVHGFALTSTERYAIAKLALFRTFDGLAAPPESAVEVRVSTADAEAFADRLDL